MAEYHQLCSICYENKEDVCAHCEKCKLQLCVHCWYFQCRTYCPICERDVLNHPQQCNFCYHLLHLKDVTVCSLCNKWHCMKCEKNELHCCESFLQQEYLKCHIKDAFDVVVNFHKYRLRYIEFRVLGVYDFELGRMYITKDLNKDNREIVMFIWDTELKDILYNRVKRFLNMKTYKIGTLNRGTKTYDPLYKKSTNFIESFMNKLDSIRQCEHCNLNFCLKTGKCLQCVIKTDYIRQWARCLEK